MRVYSYKGDSSLLSSGNLNCVGQHVPATGMYGQPRQFRGQPEDQEKKPRGLV